MIRQDQRDHLKSLMDWTCANANLLHYIQQRPEADITFYESTLDGFFRHGVTQELDCSSYDMMLFHMAGFKDPSGNGYNGFGNSAEFYSHLSHFTDPEATDLGSIVVFGPDGASHSAIVYQGGLEDPVLCSHGSEAGPHILPLSAFASQFKEHTFCSIGSL